MESSCRRLTASTVTLLSVLMSQILAQNPSERKQQKQTNAFMRDTVKSFLYYHNLLRLFSLNLGQNV